MVVELQGLASGSTQDGDCNSDPSDATNTVNAAAEATATVSTALRQFLVDQDPQPRARPASVSMQVLVPDVQPHRRACIRQRVLQQCTTDAPRGSTRRFAYVTVVAGTSSAVCLGYASGALAIAQHLKSQRSPYPLVVLVVDTPHGDAVLPHGWVEALRRLGAQVQSSCASQLQ